MTVTCRHCRAEFDPLTPQRSSSGAMFVRVCKNRKFCTNDCREAARKAARRKVLANVTRPATVARLKNRDAGRRGRIDPTTTERVYSDAEREFMLAMQHYKETAKRPFPTWSEALEVLLSLGYRKVA